VWGLFPLFFLFLLWTWRRAEGKEELATSRLRAECRQFIHRYITMIYGACNEPPPRGLRTGKPDKMYAAMIYIGRTRV